MNHSRTVINNTLPSIWHGADYNPDQWLHMPEIIDQDLVLMEQAHCSVFPLGIFSWSSYEPEEGVFHFEWLEKILDQLYAAGRYVQLATPSGARPRWLAQKYPEVLRVQENRVRNLYGLRHNHCYTSPVMREKVARINTALAQRFGKHPAVLSWHISNEIGGECFCPLCVDAFRTWLHDKYNGDLGALNKNYWSSFWAHTYTDWSQIEPFCSHGDDDVIHGLNIDWKRFVTHQTADFFKEECKPLREYSAGIPITTNLMGFHPEELEKRALANQCDFTSWDSYPQWHDSLATNELQWGQQVAFLADYTRSLSRNGHFIQMEATPSLTNWQGIAKHKRPGVHHLASLLSVAQGADGVLYFQWRAGRGGSEKFHGSVVYHDSSEENRIFQDVSDLGARLQALQAVVGSEVRAKVAIIIDTVARWGISGAQGFHKDHKNYVTICQEWHDVLWQRGISVDIRESDEDLSRYDLVIAPMLYALRPETEHNLKSFVAQGGTLLGTAITGYADENDLCYLGGFPGPLRDLYGIWIEELDTLHDHDANSLVPLTDNSMNLHRTYQLRTYCERIHAESAQVLAVYGSDYYQGEPVLTVNQYDQGHAYYLASIIDEQGKCDIIDAFIQNLSLPQALPQQQQGVVATCRYTIDAQYCFLMNFNDTPAMAQLDTTAYTCIESGDPIACTLNLNAYEVRICKKGL